MAHSNSPLATYTKISPNKTSPRNHSIDTITIHCAVAQWTAKQGCDYFVSTTRNASCNYFVGFDGSIGLCVAEKDRSWCSSNAANDHRAITIEVASATKHPYEVTTAAYNALIELLADICKRNNIKELKWKADRTLIGQTDKQNMTVHRWFANKACPGDYLYNKHSDIAEQVNTILSDGETAAPSDDAEYIWQTLMGVIGNEFGVAGLMGNLYAESGLIPYRVQGDFSSGYTDSIEYTKMVDSGEISESEFVNDTTGGGGYGLAQWTFHTRKQALYDMYETGYSSIGSVELAVDFLLYELETDFSDVLEVLKNANNIREASNKVLHDFENPAQQDSQVEETREGYGVYYYNRFSGSTPQPDSDHKQSIRKLSNFLLLAVASE